RCLGRPAPAADLRKGPPRSRRSRGVARARSGAACRVSRRLPSSRLSADADRFCGEARYADAPRARGRAPLSCGRGLAPEQTVPLLGPCPVHRALHSTMPPAADPALIDKLVLANRILYAQGVVDGFGHASTRHDRSPEHFLLARNMAPGLVRRG